MVDEIIDAGFLQKIAEEWLPSTHCITLVLTAADTQYHPLMLRGLAMSMIQTLSIHRRKEGVNHGLGSGSASGQGLGPGVSGGGNGVNTSDRLASELARWMMSSQAMTRELTMLRSSSTLSQGQGHASNNKNKNTNTVETLRQQTVAGVVAAVAAVGCPGKQPNRGLTEPNLTLPIVPSLPIP